MKQQGSPAATLPARRTLSRMILDYIYPVSVLASLPSPADLVELPYLRTALAELALLAVAGGLIGAWIVLRRLAFFAHAAGTATFPGLVIADGTGFSATVAGLAVALGYAGGVEHAGRRGRDPGDTATALVLVVALAVGIVLASDAFESGAAVDRLLFGSAFGLGGEDLWVAAGAAALALTATVLLGRAWTAAAFDPDGAATLGLPARAADRLLLALIAVAAVAALPAVGALLVASLFVVPAGIALLLSRTVGGLLLAAVAVALLQAVTGLYVSLWLDVPPGPAVAVVGATLYAVVALAASAGALGGPQSVVGEAA
jgi:ABC-type Mn2+/Zn2+ transport system permease subunit